jgi:2-polyprenyl-3-methyl-5-hydroxy-6-metoxy-1,4-benzoquinol methylase
MIDNNVEIHDQVGEDTLEVISKSENFNRWMYQTIKPYCKGKVLEIGSGIGNISSYFIQDGFEIMLTDIRESYCAVLESQFSNHKNYLGSLKMNITDPEFDKKYNKHFGQYHTVFALNVIEHIQDDLLAIQHCKKLLANGGRLIILVPSYQSLYNTFDHKLGHYRRYVKSSVSDLFVKNKIEIIHRQYFNFMGIFGWFVSGKMLKKENIPGDQMNLYNFFVPVFKIIDKLIFNRAGLSTIVVGKKIINTIYTT